MTKANIDELDSRELVAGGHLKKFSKRWSGSTFDLECIATEATRDAVGRRAAYCVGGISFAVTLVVLFQLSAGSLVLQALSIPYALLIGVISTIFTTVSITNLRVGGKKVRHLDHFTESLGTAAEVLGLSVSELVGLEVEEIKKLAVEKLVNRYLELFPLLETLDSKKSQRDEGMEFAGVTWHLKRERRAFAMLGLVPEGEGYTAYLRAACHRIK